MVARPFVKNVGGKTQLLAQILPRFPEEFSGYCEPFVGGGAVFWKLAAEGKLKDKPVVLGDKNRELMDLYREVRDDPDYLIGYLTRMLALYQRDPGALYYRVRDAWNEGVRTPGMLLFLRQTAFNGLFRYSKKGRLNSAWGHYEKPNILDADNIRACSKILQGVEILDQGFNETIQRVRPGWLVYCDPPYHGTFDGYDADGFGPEVQQDLIRMLAVLIRKGSTVVYSNAKHPEIEEWVRYHWNGTSQVHEVQARDMINRDGKGRGKRGELLVVGREVRDSDPVRL